VNVSGIEKVLEYCGVIEFLEYIRFLVFFSVMISENINGYWVEKLT